MAAGTGFGGAANDTSANFSPRRAMNYQDKTNRRVRARVPSDDENGGGAVSQLSSVLPRENGARSLQENYLTQPR